MFGSGQSSLFGQQASTSAGATPAPASGSLFGGPAATPATASGSLFGGPAATPATASGSLFGGPAATPAPAGGSLFGGLGPTSGATSGTTPLGLAALGSTTEPPPTAPLTGWRGVLYKDTVDIESVVGNFFVGDSEFTKVVVETMESIMDTGDIHKWGELKRLDSHASKHQRIATDHLLNLTCMLINRVCSLSGLEYCEKYRDILFDRIENFHNQCRDEIPQSVSRHNRAKFEYLYSYNVKTYGSILQMVGTFLTRASAVSAGGELGKRISSNHNSWFNFIHMIEFLRSLMDGIVHADSQSAADLLVSVGPQIFLIISGLCGSRGAVATDVVAVCILEESGVTLSPSLVNEGWIGSILIDLLEILRSPGSRSSLSRINFSKVTSSALNALASLATTIRNVNRCMVLNTLIGMANDMMMTDDICDEFLNCLICMIRLIPVEEWNSINLEMANHYILRTAISSGVVPSLRFRTLVIKWIRIMILGPLGHSGIVYVWRSLLALDSPVMDFIMDSVASIGTSPVDSITCFNAVELIRCILMRDNLVRPLLASSGGSIVSAVDGLIARAGRNENKLPGLVNIATHAFNIRRCRKACAYIIHQCVIRSPKAVYQVLFETTTTTAPNGAAAISSNIARMILDTKFENEEDLYWQMHDLMEIDYDHLNSVEWENLENYSLHSLLSVNSVLETEFYWKLEQYVERVNEPKICNNRLEHWLVHDNPLVVVVEHHGPAATGGTIYHQSSSRLMALSLLHESSGFLTSRLVGLVDTSVGVINDELSREIVAIDALFLVLNVSPPSENFDAHFEYLMALRVVNELLENSENREPVVRFIQYRWEHRFSVLTDLLDGGLEGGVGIIEILEMTEFLKIVATEFLIANSDIDAQHVANMREFGNTFIVSDVSRGGFRFLKFIQCAFAENSDLIIPSKVGFEYPEFQDPRQTETRRRLPSNLKILQSKGLLELFDAFIAMITNWSVRFSDCAVVMQSMIESVEENFSNELWKYCWYAKFLPRMLLLMGGESSGSSLAFYLRTLKSLVTEYSNTDNVVVKNGLVESVMLALAGFIGSAEVWMIDNDEDLLRGMVDMVFSFTSEVSRGSGDLLVSHKRTVLMAWNVLVSFMGTSRGAAGRSVDIVRNLFTTKPLPGIPDSQLSQLVLELKNLVDNDILYRELGI